MGSQLEFTPKEKDILFWIANCARNKEIAYHCSITEGTLKVYMSRLFRKTNLNRYGLTIFALSLYPKQNPLQLELFN
jgi:DNA-binding CsgD family transcriptional regulator